MPKRNRKKGETKLWVRILLIIIVIGTVLPLMGAALSLLF